MFDWSPFKFEYNTTDWQDVYSDTIVDVYFFGAQVASFNIPWNLIGEDAEEYFISALFRRAAVETGDHFRNE